MKGKIGGGMVGVISNILFLPYNFGFFDMDFGLKGNLIGSIGVSRQEPSLG